MELPKKLSKKKTENIITPDPMVAGPTIEALRFSGCHDDIREMFLNLLATSIDETTANTAHPSFVNIIQQLTSDEAKILKHIATLSEWPAWEGDNNGQDDQNNVWKQMHFVFEDAGIVKMDSAPVYIHNLIRLRLLEYTIGTSKSEWSGTVKAGPHTYPVNIEKYELIELTAYGRAFLDACVVDNHQQKSDSGKDSVTY